MTSDVKLRIAFENKGSTSSINLNASLSRTLHQFQKEGYAKLLQRDGHLRDLIGDLVHYTHVILPRDIPVNEDFPFKEFFEPPNSYPITPWKDMQLQEFIPSLNMNETRILFTTNVRNDFSFDEVIDLNMC